MNYFTTHPCQAWIHGADLCCRRCPSGVCRALPGVRGALTRIHGLRLRAWRLLRRLRMGRASSRSCSRNSQLVSHVFVQLWTPVVGPVPLPITTLDLRIRATPLKLTCRPTPYFREVP